MSVGTTGDSLKDFLNEFVGKGVGQYSVHIPDGTTLTVRQHPPTGFRPLDAAWRYLAFKDCDMAGGFLPRTAKSQRACDSYFAHMPTQLNLRIDALPDTSDTWPGQKPLDLPLTRFLELPAVAAETNHADHQRLHFCRLRPAAHRSSFVPHRSSFLQVDGPWSPLAVGEILFSRGKARVSSFLDGMGPQRLPTKPPREWITVDVSAHRPEDDKGREDANAAAANPDVHRDIQGQAIIHGKDAFDPDAESLTQKLSLNRSFFL
eukprot:GEMP01054595.1.p1 GENE.GEMP01054595.1~~GEMP01054595.1.p1  ORF type:complete len:262 (+),score=53.41 GEMP01054595.1:245-1030(+)